MKKMILIYFILIYNNLVMGEEIKNIYPDSYMILKNETIYLNANSKYLDMSDRINRTSLNYLSHTVNENYELDMDILVYKHSNNYDKFKNISLDYENKKGIQVNTFMISKNIYPDITIHAGVIPFRGGRFSEIKLAEYENRGNGIELIINQAMPGTFLSYNLDEFNFIFGYTEFNTWTGYNGLNEKNEGSGGMYSIITYEKNKHYLEFNYFDASINIYEPYGTLDLFGLGYIYDDNQNSGCTVWVEIGYSKIKEGIRDNILLDYPEYMIPYFNSVGMITEDVNNDGYAFKLGIKRNFDVFGFDSFLGTEYFKTYDGWVSMNHGVLFLSNYSYWQNRDTNMITIFGGLSVNKNIHIGFNYSKSISNKVPHYFSASNSTDIDTHEMGKTISYTNIEKIMFDLSIKF